MYNCLPKEYSIEDSRKIKDFKSKTFNGYKKNEVFSELQKNILSGNIEKSVLWATELHCSGNIEQLIDKLFYLYIKEINKANLKILPIFIKEFKRLSITKEKYNDILDLRNDQYTRNHLHNLICLITFSSKYKLPKLPTISSEDFNMDNNKSKLLSKNLNDIQEFIRKDDHKNIIIPVSEILLNLKKVGISKSFENCIFWLSWIFTYEKNYHKGYISCSPRKRESVNPKYLNDFTWILWDILLSISNNTFIQNLHELYIMDFTKSKKRKKLDLIIIAMSIIINPYPKIDFNKLVIEPEKNKIKNKIVSCINFQYLDIVLNNKPEILNKKLNKFPKQVYRKELSPMFSKEKYKYNDIELVINQFRKNDEKKPVSKKSLSNSNKINRKSKKRKSKNNILKEIKKKKRIKNTINNSSNNLTDKSPISHHKIPNLMEYSKKEENKISAKNSTPIIKYSKPAFSIRNTVNNLDNKFNY